MELLLQVVKDFTFFYILVAFVMQLLGETQMNQYLRFFAGVVFVLLLCSPLAQFFTKGNVEKELRIREVIANYVEQESFERKMEEYG